jgi:hypothetical protein
MAAFLPYIAQSDMPTLPIFPGDSRFYSSISSPALNLPDFIFMQFNNFNNA